MSPLQALFAEPSEATGSTASDSEPDEADAAAVSSVTVGRLTIQIAEAETPFGASGADTTGNAVWGAAVALATLLERRSFEDKVVVELGCGCALTSIVAARRGAAAVVATDASAAVARRAQRSVALNGVDVRVERFAWESCLEGDGGPERLRAAADVVVASDVVYGNEAVPALIAAIAHCAKKDAEILVVARDGRRGVRLFRDVAAQAFLAREAPRALPRPTGGRGADEAHTLFSYENAPPDAATPLLPADSEGKTQADLLADLDEKRSELAQCKAEMAGLQDDLRTMAATVQSDMQNIITAFTGAMTALADGDVAKLERDLDVAKLEEAEAKADAAEEAARLVDMQNSLSAAPPAP